MKEQWSVKKNHEFRRMYQRGKSAVNSYLVLYCRPNRYGNNRVGITVSTKLGKAVKRNRIRRRLREVFRLNNDRLRQGFDLILVARGRAARSSYQELDRAYLNLARELKLLKEET